METKYKILLGIGIVGLGAGIYLTVRNRAKIKEFAKALIGQEEISGNLGFKSGEFEKLMEQVGWREGDQWCVYFAKVVWYNQAPEWLKPKIKNTISGSSQTTWENVQKDPAFVTAKVPKVGDMVIWQSYKNGEPQWSGHAGVVTKLNWTTFGTVEGNTNDAGSREGYTVAQKERNFNWDTNNGLRLKGFIRYNA